MKQNKIDRRSQRTQHLVSAALMELLAEKSYDAITIQELLDKAGIGRTTFYTHYFDKEDVLASIAEQQLETLSRQLAQPNGGQRVIPSLELFQHIQANHRYFRAMLRGHAREVLWDATQTALSKTIEQSLAAACANKRPPLVPLAVMAQYLAGAFLNLLKWWLEAEPPYSPEQMDRIFQQLALPGVWAAIEGKSE
jgi:AcrR family transcriptional regulator